MPNYFDLKCLETAQRKYPTLIVKNGLFFCSLCSNSNITSTQASPWASEGVSAAKDGCNTELSHRALYKSIQKKITKHFLSKIHIQEEKFTLLRQKEPLRNCVEKNIQVNDSSTEKLLKVAYSIALHNRPFTDYPKIIELSENLGVKFGSSLRDRMTCTRMIDCIATQMRSRLLEKILDSDELFSVVIDESDNISNTCCLIFYIHTIVDDKPITLFLDIVEVKSRDSESLKKLILEVLDLFGFKDGIRMSRFAQLVTDGASTFVGSKTGVGTLLKKQYPSLITWHCLAHRLELAVTEVRKDHDQIAEIQKIFGDIHTFYNRSSLRMSHLKQICDDLCCQFKKIGRIFTIRWVASSFKSVNSLLESFEAIFTHINESNPQIGKIMRDFNFVYNLLVLKEALTIIVTLSTQLQIRNLGVIEAHKNIIACVKKLKTASKSTSSDLSELISSKKFANIALVKYEKIKMIDRSSFFIELADRIRTRSISSIYRKGMDPNALQDCTIEYITLFKFFNLVKKSNWPENFGDSYGDENIAQAAEFFKLDKIKLLAEFSSYKQLGIVGELFKKFRSKCSAFIVSSADAERGFSLMNEIMSDDRNRLLISNLSNLMFISSIKMPLSEFDPSKYSKKWLTSHQSADSTRNTGRPKNLIRNQFEELFYLF